MTYEKHGLLVDEEHLEGYAKNYARGLLPDGTSGGKRTAAELRQALRVLRETHDTLALQWAETPAMPGAVRWLLDNEYLARREGFQAAAELAAAAELRCSGGAVVVLSACEALVRSGLGEVTEARLQRFLSGFQKELVLERAELAVLVPGIRRALVLRLLRLYHGVENGDLEETEPEAARIFSSLRWLSTADLTTLLERADHIEQTLRRDPAGVYPRMADRSRAYYRRCLAAAAKREGMQEAKAAQKVLELAEQSEGERRHVGWWILKQPLGRSVRQPRGGLYITANVLFTLFLSLLPAFLTRSAAAFFLLLVPMSELVRSALDLLLLRLTPPAHVPALELPEGVPPEGRTLCVVSTLLTDQSSGAAMAKRLEECYHLSRDAGRELRYAALADFPDSDDEEFPEQAEILAAAANAVEELNRKYRGGFYLLTRPRRKNADGRWSGWERKRGALLETMRFLRGQSSSVTAAAGDPAALQNTNYLLALDSDTRLSPGAARELLGAMLHPLNLAAVNEGRGVVTDGYAILAPRIGTELAASGGTDFSRVFAPQGGTDPYGCSCSELYMDRWGRGGFAGKGVVNIDAYLACMGERVPDNLMLSHDAVEGAFLRAGFVGEVEFTDGWPGKILSNYARLERWTRGDWQNLRWLFRPGRALPDLEKWKLFDSLRRSLVPPATVAALALGFLLPGVGLTVAAAAALLALLRELLSSVAETLLRRDEGESERFHSVLFVGVGGGLVRTLLRLLLLPAEAWVCFSAVLRALWRMTVSKKRLLEWRTAAQSEGGKNGLLRHYRVLWFAPSLGAALVFLSPGIIGKTAGVLWLLTPLCAWLLNLPSAPPETPGEDDQAFLRACAQDTWQFFARFLTAEDHFLPPDNYQSQPPVGLAHRTSPTNIGLGLLSVLTAADLRFLEPERAMELIGYTLDSVEALPKWKGHFYNWYQTETLAPLSPRYVSTVDSGNLCAALTALAAGLEEYDRPDLAARAGTLAREMGFAPLFDPKRKLFYIGIDAEKNEPTPSWYDLMSSEARLTAYLAVARGDVPKEHWRRLSRALLASGVYRGMASWTGTMFEYLMPELLLPLERRSLLYETARFCLYAQQKRGHVLGRPWGVSESAFAALDPSMNYRYKAHGCGALALKRGMDDEYVVSPYSSFLALAVKPKAALQNLRRLEAMGLRDELGFWEAVDYTSSRLNAASPAKVRCVMAHHQGMSLVSCANALLGGVMVRRFLADPAMRAYTGLLQEKIPVGAPVLRRGAERVMHEKLPASDGSRWSTDGAGTDFLRPRCCLLAGESYHLLAAETGLTRAMWGAITPYVSPRSPLDAEKGFDCFLTLGGKTVSLLPRAAGDEAEYSWRFSTAYATIMARFGDIQAETSVCVAAAGTGERREVRLVNTGKVPAGAALTLRFRPLLAKYEDYVNHPAFYGLGVSARIENGCLLLRRLARGGNRELWMCLAPSRGCSFDLAPGKAEGRADHPKPASEAERFLTDPLVTVSCPLTLRPGERSVVTFALALGYGADEVLASARQVLDDASPAELAQTAASVIGMGPEEIGAAYGMLPWLCFPAAPTRSVRREELWRFGISGDLPVVCAAFSSDDQLERARKLMDRHLFLTGCGADFDLVFLTRDAAGYQKPLQNALGNALWRQGGELLRDRRGGVHILEDGPEAEAVLAAAVLRLDCGEAYPLPTRQTAYRTAYPPPPALPAFRSPPEYEWDENGSFQFYVNHALPPRQWQQMLTNGRFGCIAVDCGCGGMWYGNARENQLVPWLCRPHAAEGAEALTLSAGSELRSLFASPEGETTVSYRPGAAVWETRIGELLLRTAAFVPPDTDARVLLITCDRPAANAALHWRLDLLLGGSRGAARYCAADQGGGFFAAENAQAMAEAKPFLAMATGGFKCWTFDRASALALDYDGHAHNGEPVFAAALPLRAATVIVCGCDAPDKLRALTEPAAAQAALERTVSHWDRLLGRFSLRSPELSLDRLMNGWLGYQALACRLLGRCSIYQSGGAYGFRDQLQDAVNLIALDPGLAREQILRCCARQYTEGDVQHWWHEGDGAPRGVRTRCSDDLLWLPWALCEYVEKTGDDKLCDETAPWLVSKPLEASEKDRYEAPAAAEERDSVLTHCIRAVGNVMARGVGPHGLLPIGSGDWNDGFDAVGGESVWLSWFFLMVADRFAVLLDRHGMDVAALRLFADALASACDRAWDGAWYLRGWYADGKPLGSAQNTEGRIDSIAQSFAVLSGRADREKAATALGSAVELLFDREHGLVKLFAPPFAGAEHPGYLESYGPGFRENGGQYTHGAMWLVMALLRSGSTDTAWELLRAMLPAEKDPSVYRAEPYVLAADVYAAPGHEGEGGWSWYTGAAGWMFRIVTEELLGLRLRGGKLYIEPRLPAAWTGYSVKYRGLNIEVHGKRITVNGSEYSGSGILLQKYQIG